MTNSAVAAIMATARVKGMLQLTSIAKAIALKVHDDCHRQEMLHNELRMG